MMIRRKDRPNIKPNTKQGIAPLKSGIPCMVDLALSVKRYSMTISLNTTLRIWVLADLTFKPFARLRIASSPMRLHVDLGDSFKGMSKCKKRKAVRYGKIPKDLEDRINDVCWKAVKHYLSSVIS